MKKVLLSVALATLLLSTATAQTKGVRVESPIVTEKDFMWYAKQKSIWKTLTEHNPHDETAWLNYYNAARYMAWFYDNQNDSTAKEVVREMEAVIPDSYTFNFCAYRESVQGKGYGDHKKYAEAALAKLPDEMQFFDYDNWVCYLAMQGDEVRMKPLAKHYFDSGIYSEAVLRYSYNELAGMDESGIYIANGDAAIIPKWLIQEGMGIHKDKTISKCLHRSLSKIPWLRLFLPHLHLLRNPVQSRLFVLRHHQILRKKNMAVLLLTTISATICWSRIDSYYMG